MHRSPLLLLIAAALLLSAACGDSRTLDRREYRQILDEGSPVLVEASPDEPAVRTLASPTLPQIAPGCCPKLALVIHGGDADDSMVDARNKKDARGVYEWLVSKRFTTTWASNTYSSSDADDDYVTPEHLTVMLQQYGTYLQNVVAANPECHPEFFLYVRAHGTSITVEKKGSQGTVTAVTSVGDGFWLDGLANEPGLPQDAPVAPLGKAAVYYGSIWADLQIHFPRQVVITTFFDACMSGGATGTGTSSQATATAMGYAGMQTSFAGFTFLSSSDASHTCPAGLWFGVSSSQDFVNWTGTDTLGARAQYVKTQGASYGAMLQGFGRTPADWTNPTSNGGCAKP